MDTCGRPLYGHNGGVWEWTSTLLEGYPGFEQSEVYPGYSTDFYDGLHHVVVSVAEAVSPLSLHSYKADLVLDCSAGRIVCDHSASGKSPVAAQLLPGQVSVCVDGWPGGI